MSVIACDVAVVAAGRLGASSGELFGKKAVLFVRSDMTSGGNTSPGSKATTNVDATKAHASASDGNTSAKKAKQLSAPAAGMMTAMTTRGGQVGRKHFG
jgi:hypothetical protein